MAEFKQAIDHILASEGYRKGKSIGYVNDPDDAGGETVAGIARRFWPNSKVWPIIDAAKKRPNFPGSLVNDENLYLMILDFYKTNFWDVCHADDIHNQGLARIIVDTAVLEGLKPAIRRAEDILGLPETGIIGPKVVKLLNLLS